MMQEFGETRRWALLVRENFIDLRDNFRRIVDPPSRSSTKSKISTIFPFFSISISEYSFCLTTSTDSPVRKQVILDGLVSCGKSILLSMLVHWARTEGWLVFYVPDGREWTHGGFFYKNPQTDSWDTPIQAAQILKVILKK